MKTEGRKLQEAADNSVAIKLNVKQTKAVNKLIDTGLWGNTACACITRLLDEKLREYATLSSHRP